MRAVFTGDVTEIAANTIFIVDASNDFVIQIKIAPISYATDGFSDNVVHRSKTFVVEIVVQTVNHIFDDPVTVMHHGGTDLHSSRAEKHKFDRIAPCIDAADAGNRNIYF